MKKIVFVVSTPYTAKAFLENHFEFLSDKFELHLVANLHEEGLKNYNHPNLKSVKNISIERKINLFYDFRALIQTTIYFKKDKFDAVICFTPKAGLIGITAAKIAGIRNRIHFFTGQVWHTKTGLFKKLLIFLDKLVVKFSTKIIVDGKAQQGFLIENKILSNQNSITLGKGTISGIDIDKFVSNNHYRKKEREKLNLKVDDFVFLFLGRLNEDKGILDLARAFYQLQKKNNHIKLVLVGPDEESIQEKIKSSNYYSKDIVFFGKTNNSEQIFPMGDVFCLPSHREAFGLSIIEASSCGLPIICSDTYGLKDSIVDGITGINHKTRDSNSLQQAMEYMLLNREKRIIFGIQGRQYVEENFSKEKITKIWSNYLQEIL